MTTTQTEFPLAGLPGPVVDLESAPFWEALAAGELRTPRCTRCERRHFPPLPRCPHCGSPALEWAAIGDRARAFSWIVVHRAPRPEVPVPYTVVLAEYEDGVRIPGNMPGDAGPSLRAGMPLVASIAGRDGHHVIVYRLADADE